MNDSNKKTTTANKQTPSTQVYAEGYKAFNKSLVCNGFQFEENKIFKEKEAILCKSGLMRRLNR